MSYEVSFSFSHEHAFAESASMGISQMYQFLLLVPAQTTYLAQGVVHEAQMDVPYELVFDFGGA